MRSLAGAARSLIGERIVVADDVGQKGDVDAGLGPDRIDVGFDVGSLGGVAEDGGRRCAIVVGGLNELDRHAVGDRPRGVDVDCSVLAASDWLTISAA